MYDYGSGMPKNAEQARVFFSKALAIDPNHHKAALYLQCNAGKNAACAELDAK
jgi:TPR repeat protein